MAARRSGFRGWNAGASGLRGGAACAAAGLLAGCAPLGAPTISFFGAYFPSWLACTLAGILGAVVVRVAFIRMGVDDVLPFRLPVYASIAAGLGFLVSLLSFGR
ncbi:YtcA family lipoprotein [Xanthobacter sp. V2C-8]|uniref:YtcA family lipoprotein n=1 Tax=Xanthobacter albus TaxID=3119929 RepID=UPI00372BC33B